MFVKMVQMHPDMWFDIPVGSVNTKRAPNRITTDITVNYQQKMESYCVLYGLSSALIHCGYGKEGRRLSSQAAITSKLLRDGQIKALHEQIALILPVIGKSIAFNVRVNTNKTRVLTIEELTTKLTCFPTVVILFGNDGSVCHSVTVVDDLIFDSTQKTALKLSVESLNWICALNEGCGGIFQAFRFHEKLSTFKGKAKWKHKPSKNW